ncbi:MAG: hypothetical protein EXQ74_07175 [Thermoleophilia bacterium]|nr:hypothetical protein [Thermoleophilia bacterium]
MHEWTGLSRGRALALVTARDPREYPIGMFQRDPVPPPHTGPGTFTWFVAHNEAADFLAQIVPLLLLDPASWPDFDRLVAGTARAARTVPDDGADPATVLGQIAPAWGARADFVWWGSLSDITGDGSGFGGLVRLQYLDSIEDEAEDRVLVDDDLDGLVHFIRAYPY